MQIPKMEVLHDNTNAASRALLEASPWSAPGSREPLTAPPAGKLQLKSGPLLLGVCDHSYGTEWGEGTPDREHCLLNPHIKED